MYNEFFVDKGGHLQEHKDSGSSRLVPFPVCLAIKYGDDIAECPDFVLNIEESWVFVRTPSPLPPGTSVVMHFYIPPEDKLLADVKGKVSIVNQEAAAYPAGMLVKLSYFSRGKMQRLKRYFEEKEHLIDDKV